MKIIPQINFKSVLTGLTTKQRNKAFEELTDEGKRLEIAWDALQMVVGGLVEASLGCYWSFDLEDIEGDSKKLQNTLLDKKFYQTNYCQVCQRGLMMLSQIRLGNSIDSTEEARAYGEENIVKGFSMQSFKLMEDEYEHCRFEHPYGCNTQEKLANICCNVLVNGDFDIYDKTDYLIIKY